MKEKERKGIIEKKQKPHHGKNIKWFRKQKGYSQEYIATLFGTNTSQQQISNWENEEELSDEILSKFALFLDIGISWLKEAILDDELGYYSQDGYGNTNFQKNDQMVHAVHDPVEAMEKVYKDSAKKIQNAYIDANNRISESYNDAKEVFQNHQKKTENFYKYLIEEQKTEIERVTGENNQLIDKILVIAEKVAEKI